MRICIVNYFLYHIYKPELHQPFGGAEVQLYCIIETLKQDPSFDIHVLGVHQSTPYVKKQSGVTFWNVYNTRTQHLKKPYQILKLFYYLKKINSDAYICRAASIETGLVAFFCQVFKKRFIYMVASSIDVNGQFVREASWFAGKLYLYGIHRAHVIAQNQEQIKLLHDNYGVQADLMRNGFPIPQMKMKVMDKNAIVWVGRADTNKQPWIFTDLAKAFPQEDFILITTLKEPEIEATIDAAAKQLPNLTVLKNVSFFDIDQYYKRAKLLINTSGYEGFPNTFLQAGLYYCPTISLMVNPDFVLTTHNFGWCADGSVDTLHRLTEQALENESERIAYGNNARAYVEQYHNIEKNIDILIKNMKN